MAYFDNRKTVEPAANDFGEAASARLRHCLATWPQNTVIHR